MKKILMSLMVLTAAVVTACSSGDGDGDTTASTPQTCNGTTITTNCNNAYPNNYQYTCNNGYYNNGYNNGYYNGYNNGQNCNYGGWQFPTTYNPGQYNCGCPQGFMPVYGGYQGQSRFGYACAPFQSYVQYRQVFYFSQYGSFTWWSYGQNNRWLNNYQQSYGGNNSCANSTAQGCDVRMQNCPGGFRCQPAGPGSTIGLCAR